MGVISLISSAGGRDTPQSGVIIEGVARDSEARRAGLQPGDVVAQWSRGDDKGKIRSPLDLSWVESEQAPRGEVILEGLRGTAKQAWRLGGGPWELKARPSLPDVLLAIYRDGQRLVKEGKLTAAAARWREGAAKAHEMELSPSGLWLQLQAADTWASVKRWKEADEAYQQAINLSQEGGPQIESRLWREWARTYMQRNDWQRSVECARQALAKSQTRGANNLGAAASLNILGTIHYFRGQLDEAEKYYESALKMIEPLAPASFDAARVLNNLGNIASMRGELNEAAAHYHQALTILRKIPPEGLEVAGSLIGLFKVLSEHGDLAQAEETLRQGIAIEQRLAPGSLDLATSLNNFGLLAWQRGDLAQAENYLRQALAIREKIAPGSLWVAQSITNLGAVALERGDWAVAEKHHQAALTIKQRLAPGSLTLAINLNDLGVLAQKRGDLAQAQNYYQQAIEIREKLAPDSLDFAQSLQSLGELAQDTGDLAKAEEHYQRSLAIRERVAPDSTAHAESLAALASIVKRKGDLDTAAQLFDKALSVLEAQIARVGGGEETRVGFRTKHLNYYLDYIDLLTLNHQPELAFQVLERSRAQSLLEMLRAAHADVHTGVNPGLLKQERSLQERITAQSNRLIQMLSNHRPEVTVAALKKELDELSRRYQEVEGEIRITSPGYASLTQPHPLSARDVQRNLLDEDTLLLEYALGEERSYIWAISGTEIRSHELPKRSEIEAAAQRLYELLTARNRRPAGETRAQREERLVQAEVLCRKAAQELSQLVLNPVATDIQKKKRLLVVSDGALQYIPFALLPMVMVPSSGGNEMEAPLVLAHEIVALPSASVLEVLQHGAVRHPKAGKMVAVLADPVFSKDDVRVRALSRGLRENGRMVPAAASLRGDPLTRAAADIASLSDKGPYLPRLPFTQQEAQAIMATIPPGRGMAALGFDASRKMATSPELAHYQVVHLATHGLLDNEHPELSGLVFSLFDKTGKPQNGFLEMQDIYNLNWPVDLVVLSACETGLGRNVKGEGIVGLTRGFMYAGASRVVASLWAVDDVATSELMRRFYSAMFHEGLSPSSALRKAQLQMSEQERWKNPYYWAAFILQGDWK
jgi:CHAT domain-containing protein/Tfp pilus assembly protein PilF